MNLKGVLRKLQTAILQYDLPIKLNYEQFYSKEHNRFITVIILKTKVTYMTKDGEWKEKDYEIIRSCSMIDVVECMLDIYKAVSGGN